MKKTIKSFRGILLNINLTTKEISKEKLDNKIARNYLGGAGYACYRLYKDLDNYTDPLSPDNILMIMTGPLNGTFAPNTGRWVVCSKSPYTGLWGESNCGSWFGAELKKCGYDGIIISGASDKPVYLHIEDGNIKILDADSLWGKGAIYTTKRLKELFGNNKAKVACIGIAGENLVKYSNIVSEGRAAGRTGMGAILGSKKLKGIITKGSKIKLDVDQPEKLKESITKARERVKSSFSSKMLTKLGTAGALDMYNVTGELPIKYFTKSNWDKAYNISGATMSETILIKNRFCHSCVIGCGRRVEIKEGKYKTNGEIEGPEYETIVSFGSLNLNDDLEAITHFNLKCFDYGIDTISTGQIIACLNYHYEQGNILSSDIDGLIPEWGNNEFIESVLEKIVYRDGIGDLLAEGSNAFAAKFNIPQDEISTVVGLEVTYHDLRANYGMAIAYGMGGAYRGPSHNACDPYFTLLGLNLEEAGLNFVDKFQDNEKMAEYCALNMNYRALYSSIIMCSFCNPLPSEIGEMIEYATGIKFRLDDIKQFGERILNMKRMFNIKMGLTANDDKLPQILLRPLNEGGAAGKTPNFEKLKSYFYNFRGWDPKTGIPNEDKVDDLKLELN